MLKLKVHLDPRTHRLLAAVARAAEILQIAWMVTGAASRVMLLEIVYGLPQGRATEDVDFGVMVGNWAQYRALVERICEDRRFKPDSKQRQRIRHADGGYLDLIPFGDIESGGHTIHWPPDDDFTMTVMGFQESLADAVRVSVDNFTVPVVSPVGLVLLKLFAWKDRHHVQPRKDAADIAYVLRHYSTLLTEKVLFDDYFDIVEASGFDVDLAAGRVLGSKIAKLAAPDTRRYLKQLLDNELLQGTDPRLVREVAETLAEAAEERAFQLLSSLKMGFDEGAAK